MGATSRTGCGRSGNSSRPDGKLPGTHGFVPGTNPCVPGSFPSERPGPAAFAWKAGYNRFLSMQDVVSEVSRHKCLIYDGHPSEQLPVIVPLLQEGLRRSQRCLYLGDGETVSMVDAALKDKGVDTEREARRGALVYSSDRSHLKGGFDPRAMVGMLRGLIDEAVRDGFQGLCATGDMMWELGSESNFDRLQEYEALLEQVFHEKPLMGICQYRRDTVPPRAIREALLTHRSVYVGAHLNRDNLFYMPPELLLPNADVRLREAQGEWMCQQITRVLQAEHKRDQ